MNPTPPYDDILGDETLAPLKRNHACLQCKKRKVKCDATKPSCSPCLRSHAHAVRSAHRNGTAPPILTCTYAEGDSPEPTMPDESGIKKKKSNVIVPSSLTSTSAANKRHATGQGKRDSIDDEKEALKARIADLEARLAGLTPPSSHSGIEPSLPLSNITTDGNTPFATSMPRLSRNNTSPGQSQSEPLLEEIGFGQNNASYVNPTVGLGDNNSVPLPETIGDFSGLDDFFLVPKDWPKGLPLPFLLEHLVETFFNYVPQTPRMLNRPSILARIKLPPSSPDFPFTGLLHAICAAASTYTAWVNNLAPHTLESAVQQHLALGLDLSTIEDFGLSQAHLGNRAIDTTTSACMMGSGPVVFQLAQTCILLGDVYFQKGFPMKGWMLGGQPARFLAVLELCNREPRKTYKVPLLSPPEDDFQREERLITTWMAFVVDAGFAINSNWIPSMSLKETRCHLPTSAEDWAKGNGMRKNPQHAGSADLYYSHPVEDSFVFVIKGSTLMAQVAQWLREWQQRERKPGDELSGPQTESFQTIALNIEAFSTSLPAALKHIFRFPDSRTTGFDANLLSIHLIPNIGTCLLYEPFLLWQPYDPATITIQRAYDSIMTVLHLIPSNLDITLVLTPFLALSLFTVGRFVADFIKHADSTGQAQTALRYRADLMTLINLLDRYGQRHPLGFAMVHFLEQYMTGFKPEDGSGDSEDPKCQFSTARITYPTSDGQNPETRYLNKLSAHMDACVHDVGKKTVPINAYDNIKYDLSPDDSNSLSNGNGVFSNANNNITSIPNSSYGSRSNSIVGISPNGITPTLSNNAVSSCSNQPTPESINSCNMECPSISQLDNINIVNSTSYGMDLQQQQQHQEQAQSQSQSQSQTQNHLDEATWATFDQWSRNSLYSNPKQHGTQVPIMNFLGNLDTSSANISIPVPTSSVDRQHDFNPNTNAQITDNIENLNWKNNLFMINDD
ncbi:uncharacterized protein IL334_001271 [Kwoniella shivajii]|uniref:Zn(2)-C6 fungal-type domain-containing protein n=1 Tax=Kwoniella shivajii TaxID=564305 RepID=A0ABZ1CT30_9TREE|nr:hypothetical protein IL334_001271 [Kwoniella shivajii]